MKRFEKIYLEISNICNLLCNFCPGTTRPKKAITEEEFRYLLDRISPWTDYLYFHLMGEPLCHPMLERFLELAGHKGLRVILTTNGTLLSKNRKILLSSPALHKINVSLHAFEANDLSIPFAQYIRDCLEFGQEAQGKKIVVYRLWNQGGANELNDQIHKWLKESFPEPWVTGRQGIAIGNRVFLEYGDKFDWPDLTAQEGAEQMFCYGLRDQIGILCDGTVVPCCLDHDGKLALGNLFQQSMEDILSSEKAQSIYRGFSQRIAVEELCRKCGYARRFS